MSAPSPGWYDDGSGRQRWWNGSAWTEQFADVPVSAGPVTKASRRWVWWMLGAIGVALVVSIALLSFWLSGIAEKNAAANRVIDYLESANAGDCDAVEEMFTSRLFDEEFSSVDGGCESIWSAVADDYQLEVVSADVTGSTAEVELFETWTYDSQTTYYSYRYELVRDEGEWRIDGEEGEEVDKEGDPL